MNDYSESLLVHFRRVETLKNEVIHFSSIDLNKRQLCDLELLLNRAFYPLKGYMTQEDYNSVLDRLCLKDGTFWPIPICLDIDSKSAEKLEVGGKLAIRDEEGFLLAVLTVEDIWQPDKKREAINIIGTDDPTKHPEVLKLYEEKEDYYVGGTIEGIQMPIHYDFKHLRLSPAETHRIFTMNGWRKVIGFRTDRPLHCAHKEMTLRAAREAGASIFMQPAVGYARPRDLDHYTQVRCYQEIIKKYPRNMISLGLITLDVRKFGPRSTLWQAMILKNYGCTHFMVADDQDDPFADTNQLDRFYSLHSAQDLLAENEEKIGIKMIPLKKMVYVETKAQYMLKEEIEDDMAVKEISSSELMRRLEFGLEIPEWFSFKEVVKELRHTYPPRSQQGFTIFMTGLSGSGKSTLAQVLLVKFKEMRTRPVTLLDGDIVRKNLSSNLDFSKAHRNINIKRIGFVASEITKNRGIAICAPIAPYEESRQHNRELISQYGGYIEVYVSTALSVCEKRDRKGIYAKARAGIIKGVTGIDDPFDPPQNPDLVIDTYEITPEEAAQEVLLYLEEYGYIH